LKARQSAALGGFRWSTLSSAGTPSPRAIDECTTTTHIHHPLPPQSSHFSAQYRLLRLRINTSRSVRAPKPIISHPPSTTMAPSTFASAAAGSNSNAQPRDAGSEWYVQSLSLCPIQVFRLTMRSPSHPARRTTRPPRACANKFDL
jgi:hypothetical protein